MDFFSNIIKTTVSKVENLSKTTFNTNSDNTEDIKQIISEDNKQLDQNCDNNIDKQKIGKHLILIFLMFFLLSFYRVVGNDFKILYIIC